MVGTVLRLLVPCLVDFSECSLAQALQDIIVLAAEGVGIYVRESSRHLAFSMAIYMAIGRTSAQASAPVDLARVRWGGPVWTYHSKTLLHCTLRTSSQKWAAPTERLSPSNTLLAPSTQSI